MSGQTFIDQLPAATLPLAGTEPTVIVQSGATRQAPMSAGFFYVIPPVGSFTPVWGNRYGVQTSLASVNVNLPLASVGMVMEVADVNHNAFSNPFILVASSPQQLVMGGVTSGSQTISQNGAVTRLICYAANTIRVLVMPSA